MAKDKKNVSLIDATDENIEEQIKNANRYSDEIVKKAAEIQKKKEEDKQIAELNRIKDKATYINLTSVAQTRLARAREKAVSAFREKSRELLKDIMEGKLTAVEYDDKIDEAINSCNGAIRKALEDYRSLKNELNTKFDSHYSYDWNNPFNRIININN